MRRRQLRPLLLGLLLAVAGCGDGDRQARELYDRLRAAGLGHSEGQPACAVAFDCVSRGGSPPAVDVHIVFPWGDYVARECDCDGITQVMSTLAACCQGQAGSASVECKGGTSFYVSCVAGGPVAMPGRGPGKPELGVTFPGGFSRSLWSCQKNGQRNPDIVALEQVAGSCCLE